ncbi:hypothetical protein [Nocardia niigatensis]
MGLSTYNGFDGAYREKVQAELERMWTSGLWQRPSECAVCGQTRGAIHGHLEDYSRPETYVPLCITCHLILHMRFRQPDLWDAYTEWIRAGWRPAPQEQRTAMAAIKRHYLPSAVDSWPGLLANKPSPVTYLDGLAPIRFEHPNAPVGVLF